MKEIIILKNDANQRFDKYLKKLLVNASSGFIYKMLRKKNITLNGAKADGSEMLSEGNIVKLFFSDETYDKFVGLSTTVSQLDIYKTYDISQLDIIYEDDDIILINKTVNMLSQKAKDTDISANELLISYMVQNNMLTEEEYRTFHPSVCNRLDQNTTGILIFGKSLKGLQTMSEALKKRSAHKYYYAVVNGNMSGSSLLKGYLIKNEKNNTVTIDKERADNASYVETKYKGLSYNSTKDITLVEIELITGKTHQIRAHLASIGHGIIGDYKYGNREINNKYKNAFGISSQLLHAKRVELPGVGTFEADEPFIFHRIME